MQRQQKKLNETFRKINSKTFSLFNIKEIKKKQQKFMKF